MVAAGWSGEALENQQQGASDQEQDQDDHRDLDHRSGHQDIRLAFAFVADPEFLHLLTNLLLCFDVSRFAHMSNIA